jgi:hypothetical protein
MFEPHKFTRQPPDVQAPRSALRQDLPNISFEPLGDVATIAAVEQGDGCQASATLLDAFLDERAAAKEAGGANPEDEDDDEFPIDRNDPEFKEFSRRLDEEWAEAAAKRRGRSKAVSGNGSTRDDGFVRGAEDQILKGHPENIRRAIGLLWPPSPSHWID